MLSLLLVPLLLTVYLASGHCDSKVEDGDSMPLRSSTSYNEWPGVVSFTTMRFSSALHDGTYTWFCPMGASHFVRVSESGEMKAFGFWPREYSDENTGFFACAYDGVRYIWAAPHTGNGVIRLDTQDGSMKLYNAWPKGWEVKSWLDAPVAVKFLGAVLVGTSLWMSSGDGNMQVRLDTTTGVMTGCNNWPSGYAPGEQGGMVYDGQGFVWSGAFGSNMIIKTSVDVHESNEVFGAPSCGSMEGFSDFPKGIRYKQGTGVSNWFASVFDGQSVWMSAVQASAFLAVDPKDGAMSKFDAWPQGYDEGEGFKHYGAVAVAPFVYFAPRDANMLVRLHTGTGVMLGFNTWPEGFTKGPDAFVGIALNSKDNTLWLSPFSADQIVRLTLCSSDQQEKEDL